MTEKRWTPGPWRVIEKEKPVGFAKYEIAWSDDDELVCDVVYHPEDAHLIAAAPELYESIKEGIDSLEFAVRELAAQASLPDGELELCEERLTEMRTALSKARGETDEPNR